MDVVLLGTSEVFTGFSAPEAYEVYGFTSYPFAAEALSSEAVICAAKEAIRCQSPKLLVIEVNSFLSYAQYEMESVPLRRFIESMPFSRNKVDAIQTLVKPSERLSYWLPIIHYHSGWEDIGVRIQAGSDCRAAMAADYARLKGAFNRTDILRESYQLMEKDSEVVPLSEEAEAYLRAVLVEFQDAGVDNILFVRFPTILTEGEYASFLTEREKRFNRIEEIIKESGYEYLDFQHRIPEIGLKPEEDFYNNDHMNVVGQKKFTVYFGKLLQTRYGIGPSLLADSQRAKWEASVEKMHRFYDYSLTCIANGVHAYIGEEEFDRYVRESMPKETQTGFDG